LRTHILNRVGNMFLSIVKKELHDQLKSFRLIIIFSLLSVVMVTSALLYIPSFNQEIEDYTRNRNESLDRLSSNASRKAAIFWVFSMNFNGPWVYKMPNKLGFIYSGHEKNLPNSFSPSAFRVYGPVKRIRSNVLLWRTEAVDWYLIIGIVLSFAAIVLTFDAVCGERENGTLKLMMSNSVSRPTILSAKFTGILLRISIVLLFSIVLYLLILLIGGIPLSGWDFLIVFIVFMLSIVYISVFIMLGLFISSSNRISSSSLVISLLCWVFLVIIIPGTGGLIAAKVSNLPDYNRKSAEANEAQSEAVRSYRLRNPDAREVGYSGHWSPGEPLDMAFELTDGWSNVFDEYRYQMINQVEKARRLILISPTASYAQILESFAGSGIFHYTHFFEELLDYKMVMRQYLIDVYPYQANWHRKMKGFSEEEINRRFQELYDFTLDFEDIPKFTESRPPLQNSVSKALPGIALLAIFNVLLFALTFVNFIRYDVR